MMIFKQRVEQKRGFQSMILLIGIIMAIDIVIFPLPVSPQSVAPDNLVSTVQIIVKLCYVPGVSSEKVAWQFFACYDHVPGKQLFIKCQQKTFKGVLFNSVRNIKKNCGQPLTKVCLLFKKRVHEVRIRYECCCQEIKCVPASCITTLKQS